MSRSVFVLLFIHMIGRVSERKSYRYNSRIADSFGATSGITRVCTIITEDSFCFKLRMIPLYPQTEEGELLGQQLDALGDVRSHRIGIALCRINSGSARLQL